MSGNLAFQPKIRLSWSSLLENVNLQVPLCYSAFVFPLSGAKFSYKTLCVYYATCCCSFTFSFSGFYFKRFSFAHKVLAET